MKPRSNKPIFWSLFGAGGMLCALAGPGLVYLTGFRALHYEQALHLARSLPGKAAILAVISLFLFHGCHRMYHCLHDFGIHVGAGLKAAFHGFAAAGSLAAAVLLILV
ncbi:MAG: fumarate reductase subunit FrdD [Clostridia bacterium]